MTGLLDPLLVDRYLSARIPGFRGPVTVQKFPDGQSNPTFLINAQSGRYVLRRKPPGVLLKSAHAVDREFQVMQALTKTDVPVPQVLHFCADPDVIGTEFFVMTFVAGRTFWNPALPELSHEQRRTCYDQMNKVLAAIHSVDISAVGLTEFGKPGNYFARQFARWLGQYRQSQTEDIPDLEAVIGWLEANPIEDDGQVSLVHGDFRLDNMMFTPDGGTINAVLDWELSTLGHPFADLAYQCALWRLPPDSALAGLGGIDRAALGLPSEDAYVAAYCARRGLAEIKNWRAFLVFSLFRMAAIVQGVKKRGLEGNASSDRALSIGSLVGPLSKEAASLI